MCIYACSVWHRLVFSLSLSRFARGSQKVKLDRFLMYFQRYCLSKVDPPVDLEFDLQDLYELLRPNLKRFDNLEDACKAVEAMEREELEKLAKATQVVIGYVRV